MAKRRKSKGKRRGGKRKGKKKGRGRARGHQFGIAESLGLAKTVFEVETNTTTSSLQKAFIKNPSVASFKAALESTVAATKDNASTAVLGIVVSNADKLPFVGKLLAKPKHKLDAITRKMVGMRL